MSQEFKTIAKIFGLNGEITSAEKISNGIINKTYDVRLYDGKNESRYVFQCINLYVFKNPIKIMENIEKITAHIAKKLDAEGKSRDRVMHFAQQADGKNYYIAENEFCNIFCF